jgi:hypothetical protein
MPSRSQQRRVQRLGLAARARCVACLALASFAPASFALLACSREPSAVTEPLGPVVTEPLAVSGRLTLAGGLADSDAGAIVVRLVEQATGRVLLQRTYDLADPLWDRREVSQVLYFALDARDGVASGAPVHAPLVLEAVHVSAGRGVLARQDDTRVAVALARPARELELELRGEAVVAGADAPKRDAPR